MNILSVASILPIPGVISYNDFVLQTYQTYQKRYPEDQVVIIKPVKIELSPMRWIKRQTTLQMLKKKRSLEVRGFRVEVMPFFSFYSFQDLHIRLTRSLYFLNRKRIRSLFSGFAFDVVHGQYIYPDGMLARMLSRRFKIPYLITSHNERYFFDRTSSRNVTINILKGASMVVPINHTNHTYFKSLGIDHSKFLPLGFQDEFIRDQKPLNVKSTSIFTASVLIKLKNIDKVIHAMERLVKRHPVTYTIIGKGPEKARLLSLVESLHLADHVFFLDHVPHDRMADEMYKHDIMIMYGVKPGEIKYSLYSAKDEFDVSEIAKRYGGGGHKGAAGFYSKELLF